MHLTLLAEEDDYKFRFTMLTELSSVINDTTRVTSVTFLRNLRSSYKPYHTAKVFSYFWQACCPTLLRSVPHNSLDEKSAPGERKSMDRFICLTHRGWAAAVICDESKERFHASTGGQAQGRRGALGNRWVAPPPQYHFTGLRDNRPLIFGASWPIKSERCYLAAQVVWDVISKPAA